MIHEYPVSIHDVSLAYNNTAVLKDMDFSVKHGEIFVVMGGSGSGKSTLMKAMVGLLQPSRGRVLYGGTSFWEAQPDVRRHILRRIGILYQRGALWSSMTLAENVALPLEEFTGLKPWEIRDLVGFKLSLVGLSGFENSYPSQISGGMVKRAALARAMALDPEILFFDEPSAGLDPVSARLLDELILELRESLHTTIVVITHDLESIFSIADSAIFLDSIDRTMIAWGNPRDLLERSEDPRVRRFLTRGRLEGALEG
ncbi:MAG: ATP-binding cassette domain-containing protein [Desulfomonilia bacterium]|jgi:phospholipid/cholesterol/gamma-HCH transport system ATP-binding protein|nr:ATP-binding cassette domain-containing protein [Deltaproteobacteria bacterium]MDX9760716.1 ATP-binding cassette domain-containing protein [Desulfomonilia bacterium]HPW68619.1 ATP-binding cassette domain-containing protein [Deltaproteobacteria bacterium]